MGVHNLIKLIKDYAPKAIKEYPFYQFEGYTVAVEASMLMYMTVIAIRGTGKDLVNRDGCIVSHLKSIMYKILMFLQNKMTPIFVFDGKPPALKEETIDERRAIKTEAEEKLKKFDNDEKKYTNKQYIDLFKDSYRPSKNEITKLKMMLDLMGIPYIDAPGEAEAYCAFLNSIDDKKEISIKGVASDDSDTLIFGAKYLFKDMLKFMKGDNNVKVISLSRVLKELKITMDQFIDLAILLGNDYIKSESGGKGGTIPGVGYVTALDLIRQHGDLKSIIKLYKHKLSQKLIDRMYKARDEFKNSSQNIQESKNFSRDNK